MLTNPSRLAPASSSGFKQNEDEQIRNDCGASLGSVINDFDNQMATFHFFAVSLDLNMDRYTESAWKPDPNRHQEQTNKMMK